MKQFKNVQDLINAVKTTSFEIGVKYTFAIDDVKMLQVVNNGNSMSVVAVNRNQQKPIDAYEINTASGESIPFDDIVAFLNA